MLSFTLSGKGHRQNDRQQDSPATNDQNRLTLAATCCNHPDAAVACAAAAAIVVALDGTSLKSNQVKHGRRVVVPRAGQGALAHQINTKAPELKHRTAVATGCSYEQGLTAMESTMMFNVFLLSRRRLTPNEARLTLLMLMVHCCVVSGDQPSCGLVSGALEKTRKVSSNPRIIQCNWRSPPVPTRRVLQKRRCQGCQASGSLAAWYQPLFPSVAEQSPPSPARLCLSFCLHF